MLQIPPPRELTLPNGERMRFCGIPAGEFRMGQRGIYADEEPVHRVVIPYPFWMAETPVTQAQYAAWKLGHDNEFPGDLRRPAERMTWHDARGYVDWLNTHCGPVMPAGYRAALPLEIEWEYACRAGTTTEYHTGDGEPALNEAGWWSGNSGSSTQPVAQKRANDWGLFDLHGNVWEWCDDVWDADAYKTRRDGYSAQRIWDSTTNDLLRVLRGGSWDSSASDCRAALRIGYDPGSRNWYIGFRLVLVPGPQSSRTESRKTEPEGGAGVGGRARRRRPEAGARARRGRTVF